MIVILRNAMTTSTSYNVQLDVSNFPESVIENADWKTFRMLLVSELADSLAKDVEYRTRGDMKNKGVQLDKDLTHGIYRYSMKFSTEDGEHRIDVSDIMETLSSYSGQWQVLSDVTDKMVGKWKYIPSAKASMNKPYSTELNTNGFWKPKISIQKVWA